MGNLVQTVPLSLVDQALTQLRILELEWEQRKAKDALLANITKL